MDEINTTLFCRNCRLKIAIKNINLSLFTLKIKKIKIELAVERRYFKRF